MLKYRIANNCKAVITCSLVKSVFGHINYLPPEMYNIEGEGMIIFLQCCTFEHIFLTQQQVFGGTNHTMIDFHSCKIQHTNF